tara:strand:- start:1952 stop:2146 length:195 start_codon:yes stop_codon:yes gene_type:complete
MSNIITKYWEATAIDFGKYVLAECVRKTQEVIPTPMKSAKELWNEFQEQMVKDVGEVLDGADKI